MADSALSSVGTRTHDRASKPDVVLLLLLLVSLVVNVVLGTRYSTIVTQVATDARLLRGVPVGDTVPPLVVEQSNGSPIVIDYKGESEATVLYVFSRTCAWCQRNLANISALADALKRPYKLVGISLDPPDETQDYLRQVSLRFPVYQNPSAESIAAYGLRGTPHTFVISPSGRVLQSWRGAYTGAIGAAIEAHFGIALPGVILPRIARATQE